MSALNKLKLNIEVQFASASIEKKMVEIASLPLLKKWAKTAIRKNGQLTLRFVNHAESRRLNFHFRRIDKATNVLTFLYDVSQQTVSADIVLCLPVISREAITQKKLMHSHLAHMIIHGCLHAQGYDNEAEKDANIMEAKEVALLDSLGFASPYLAL